MILPKFNQKGVAHLMAPILFIAIFAAVGGYVLLKGNAAPVSLVIAPGDWQTVKDASIVTDYGNKVVKLNPYVSGSKSHPGGHVDTLGPATNTYLNGKPLAKFHNFITDHFNQPATICMTARASQANSSLALFGTGFTQNSKTNIYGLNKTVNLGKSYSNKCYNFTIISEPNYKKHFSKAFPEELVVQVDSSGDTGYLDSVAISLR